MNRSPLISRMDQKFNVNRNIFMAADAGRLDNIVPLGLVNKQILIPRSPLADGSFDRSSMSKTFLNKLGRGSPSGLAEREMRVEEQNSDLVLNVNRLEKLPTNRQIKVKEAPSFPAKDQGPKATTPDLDSTGTNSFVASNISVDSSTIIKRRRKRDQLLNLEADTSNGTYGGSTRPKIPCDSPKSTDSTQNSKL